MKDVLIYTDGACSGNRGPGGWGAVLFFGVHQGHSENEWNNRCVEPAREAIKRL